MSVRLSIGGLLLLLVVSSYAVTSAAGISGPVGCADNPVRVERLILDKPGVYENFRVDGQWAGQNLVKISADHVTLRRSEILRGRHNGIVIDAENVVIDSCRIHQLLKGTFASQQDAHGITGRPRKLTIRNCEISHVSGDAVQFDPGRGAWDEVTIQNCTFWKGPLPEDAAGFRKGESPGENAVDTKQSAANPRSRLTIRNSVFRGWNQPGQIDLVAALNLKNHVEVAVVKCVFADNQVSFRLRGPDADGRYGGAKVSISDCVVSDSAVGVRVEDRIADLQIRRLGFGSGVAAKFVSVAGGAGPGFLNEGEYALPVPEKVHKPEDRVAPATPASEIVISEPVAAAKPGALRTGRVRISDHSLADHDGPFLGLGVSYFTSLWRCKHDRPRLESDLSFLSRQGFNYYRMLSMVGYHAGWDGREIAPVSSTRRDGKRLDAWPDYWEQFRDLIDVAYDRYGLRTQITIFADAQLMPDKEARMEHMRKLLAEVVPGREHKIIMLEVANEAWQNGFPGDQGVADLREFAKFLNSRTELPVAITSNHDYPELGGSSGFEQVYAGADADLATWHFSRDRRTDGGWKPVYDCWDFGDKRGFPPVSSNEPIGPGSSVNTEKEPIRLVMAAAFAYAAKLPMYVFHSEAGVFGKSRFEDTPAVDRYMHILRLLPADLPNWQRNDGKEANAPFTVFAAGEANRYWPEVNSGRDGCVRNTGSRKGDQFVCVPIGIREDGLELQARQALSFTAYDPLTGNELKSATMHSGEKLKLPPGPGALLILGHILPLDADKQGQR